MLQVVVGQQRPTMETGKRQFVDMAGVVVVGYSFSMSWRAFHAAYPTATRHCWTSQQWHPRARPQPTELKQISITVSFLFASLYIIPTKS